MDSALLAQLVFYGLAAAVAAPVAAAVSAVILSKSNCASVGALVFTAGALLLAYADPWRLRAGGKRPG